MKEVKINVKYKLYYATCMFIIYATYLLVYYLATKSYIGLLEHVFIWGIPSVFIFYLFVYRMKMQITDKDQIIYKPVNSLSYQTINIRSIAKIVLHKKRYFNEVIVHCNDNNIKLHPQNPTAFIEYINARDKNTFQQALLNDEGNRTHS